MDLASSEAGLWYAALTAGFCSFMLVWGAMHGVIQHRLPRILVATAVFFIALSYWGEVLHWFDGRDMRRGAGFLLWPSLAWTAWSGVMYSRSVVQARTVVEEILEDDDD